MPVNIKIMTAGQLLTLRNDIDMRLGQMAAELEKQLVQIKGLSAPTTRRRRRSPLKGKKASPKYRNSANPKETWAARGMKPRWLTAALKSGRKLESFEIKK